MKLHTHYEMKACRWAILFLGVVTVVWAETGQVEENRVVKRYEQGFLEWQITETEVGNTKHLSGVVRWNQSSGAGGEPVIGMPLVLVVVHHETQELTPIAQAITDEKGRFKVSIETKEKVRIGGDVSQTQRMPTTVWNTLQKGTRPPEETQQVERLIELRKRVNETTPWGQRVHRWMTGQRREFFIDQELPASAFYSIADNRIYRNPQFDAPVEQQVADARNGYLSGFILLFHEVLHQAQENQSRWGVLWKFLRETGQIERYVQGDEMEASDSDWLRLSHELTGQQGRTGKEAKAHFRQWQREMQKTASERTLLREIQAYWISDVLTVDALYHLLYERNVHGSYANLTRVDPEQFRHLCEMIDALYAVYDGDFNQFAAFVGNADSMDAFEKRAVTVISEIDKGTLKARRDRLQQEKNDWKQTTQRFARDVFRR